MDLWIILLIGIVYVAQSQVAASIIADNGPILSENGQKITCGRRWKPKGVMYHVFNRYEHDEGNTLQPPKRIYEYCIDEDTKLVMYAGYNLDDPTLLKPVELQYERQESDVSEDASEPSPRDEQVESGVPAATIPIKEDLLDIYASLRYSRQGSDASDSSKPYERQLSTVKTYSPKETFETRRYYGTPSTFEFRPQMVVVPELMPLMDIKKVFHSFFITAPMQAELIDPWKQLMKNIESKIYKIKEPLRVYSGAYDTYRLHGVSWYMDRPKHKLPVPFAWFLLLQNAEETRGISVVMQNYAFSPGEKKEALCGESVCDRARLEIPNFNRAWIYCCPASTITEEYPLTTKVINDLLVFE